MQIIKDKHIVDDTWQHISDDETIPAGDVTLSLARWQQEKHTLIHRAGQMGVRLNSTDDVAVLADDIKRLALIELVFADFADGRAVSFGAGNYCPNGATLICNRNGNFYPLAEIWPMRTGGKIV